MKKIIFVDDEPNILDAMRNMLRKQRKVWDMAFVNSGEEALTELAKCRYDVIVSDMRMPGMDGATLLEKVRNLYPGTARFVLSGQADQESIFRVLPVAQQFLSKPCDPEEMKTVVERTCLLQASIDDENIRSSVGKLENLPSASAISSEWTRLIDSPSTSIQDLAKIVEQDPAMVAKVLQIVNSAFFGLAKKSSTIGQAVSYLGVDLLRALSRSAKAFQRIEADENIRGFVRDIQQQSVETAQLAALFATHKDAACQMYTAALLRDVGVLALIQSQDTNYAELLISNDSLSGLLHQTEQGSGIPDHAAVGAHLLGLWGLPFAIVEAVSGHHQPKIRDDESDEIVLAVHVADALCSKEHPDLKSKISRIHLPAIVQGKFESHFQRWLEVYQSYVRRTSVTPPLSSNTP